MFAYAELQLNQLCEVPSQSGWFRSRSLDFGSELTCL